MVIRNKGTARARLTMTAYVAVVGVLVALVMTGSSALASSGTRSVVWRGDGVDIHRASGDLPKLARTNREFRAFTKKKLNQLWGWTDNDPDCRTAPLIVIKRWRSDGWAQITNMGVFAQPEEKCAQGGHWEIWGKKDGRWRTVVAGQDVPRCGELRRKEVPVGFADYCFSSQGDVVRYTGP
jgi:hypothetical protein